MNGMIVDYRIDRTGKIYAKCRCGTEQILSANEARKLVVEKPEVLLRVGAT